MSCPSETISEPLGGPKVIPQITSTETPVNQSALGADPTNTYSDGGTGGIGNSIHPPSNRPLSGGGFSGGEMAAGEPSNYAANIASDTTLGSLSAKYESNGNPKIIGRDSTGGYSYGEYQIATKVGTFGNYMDFLQTHHPDTYNELQAAGGESTSGSRNEDHTRRRAGDRRSRAAPPPAATGRFRRIRPGRGGGPGPRA